MGWPRRGNCQSRVPAFARFEFLRALPLFSFFAIFLVGIASAGATEPTTVPAGEAPSQIAPVSSAPDTPHFETDTNATWPTVLAIISVLTALAAISVSFYFYRERRIILANHPNPLVPEKWGDLLRQNNAEVSKSSSAAVQQMQTMSAFIGEQTAELRKMTETFMTFQKALDAKDAEIARLREGFDSHVYKRFLKRFIRVHQSLEEIAADGEPTERDLRFISVLLRDALEESAVVAFEPEIGADFQSLGSRVADNPMIKDTDGTEDDFAIASVDAPGYELSSGEGEEILIPARVTIYKRKNDEPKERT